MASIGFEVGELPGTAHARLTRMSREAIEINRIDLFIFSSVYYPYCIIYLIIP